MLKTEEPYLNAKQKEALEKSIKHWEGIVAGTEGSNGRRNCECCKQFHAGGCKDCPVYIKTGFMGCENTPYDRFCDECAGHRYPCSMTQNCAVNPAVFVERAQAELDFLISCRNPS